MLNIMVTDEDDQDIDEEDLLENKTQLPRSVASQVLSGHMIIM